MRYTEEDFYVISRVTLFLERVSKMEHMRARMEAKQLMNKYGSRKVRTALNEQEFNSYAELLHYLQEMHLS